MGLYTFFSALYNDPSCQVTFLTFPPPPPPQNRSWNEMTRHDRTGQCSEVCSSKHNTINRPEGRICRSSGNPSYTEYHRIQSTEYIMHRTLYIFVFSCFLVFPPFALKLTDACLKSNQGLHYTQETGTSAIWPFCLRQGRFCCPTSGFLLNEETWVEDIGCTGLLLRHSVLLFLLYSLFSRWKQNALA